MVVALIIPLAVMVFAYTRTGLTLHKSVMEARAMARISVKYELFCTLFGSVKVKKD